MKSITQLDEDIIRVIIADDQLIIRKKLELQLADINDIEVVALAKDGMNALEKIAELTPDVILIDLEMPNMDGISAIKEICNRFSGTKALVFSTHEEREYINQAIIAGAKGYLLKGTSTPDLVTAIRNIYKGYFQLGSGLLEKISLSTSQVSLDSSSLSPMNLSDTQQISNLESKISDLINLETNSNYDKLKRLLERRIEIIAAEQSRNYALLKKFEFKFYLLLFWQGVLTLILLLNI